MLTQAREAEKNELVNYVRDLSVRRRATYSILQLLGCLIQPGYLLGIYIRINKTTISRFRVNLICLDQTHTPSYA